jgi:large subunit ribosomal protein L6
MSRIGAKALAIPAGVTVTISGSLVTVKGPKGELKITLLPEVAVAVEGTELTVTRKDNSIPAKARHGLTRQLINNMVMGVTQGFEKGLEIIGVGYKALIKGKVIVFNLGHSHPINFDIPAGIEVVQDEKNKNIVYIRGIDKQLVGQVASDIRILRPPEPYKGKGIKYLTETIRRKAGKAAAAKGGGA